MEPVKKKIINDPVYGFITLPLTIIFDLIEHPYFQRLRRIKQLGLTDYVYPGAVHTRFHHALGAVHLMSQAIEVLRSKGAEISSEEFEAVTIAILLHDIGHGPFSHALEHIIMEIDHEDLSLLFMEKLNEEFDGRLDLAIKIFRGDYEKRFLHQLVSGQLDMDRMDYLTRDSFFTGVHEGIIGYDRIIKMLDVHNGQLVVEEKGIYSIEKFLVARRLMYWQAYFHKAVISAEQMLINAMLRARELLKEGKSLPVTENLGALLKRKFTPDDLYSERDTILQMFSQLDDYDIVSSLKAFIQFDDFTLSYLSKGLVERKLFKIVMGNQPFDGDVLNNLRLKALKFFEGRHIHPEYLIFTGSESNRNYSTMEEEIMILRKNSDILPISSCIDLGIIPKEVVKYYLCLPKEIGEF